MGRDLTVPRVLEPKRGLLDEVEARIIERETVEGVRRDRVVGRERIVDRGRVDRREYRFFSRGHVGGEGGR
jgi:hypothetical protein